MTEDVTVIEEPTYVVVESTAETVTVPNRVVEVVSVGIQGPPGVGSDKHYEQSFTGQSSVTVTHNLGKLPAVSIIDTANDEVEGAVNHISNDQFIVNFSSATSGVIYCN